MSERMGKIVRSSTPRRLALAMIIALGGTSALLEHSAVSATATTQPAATPAPSSAATDNSASPPANAAPVLALPATTQPATASKPEELTQWILDLLQRFQPELYAKAVTLQKSDPKKLEQLLKNAVPNFRELKERQVNNPPLFQAYMKNLQLSYETVELAKRLRNFDGSADEKAALRDELGRRVSDQFDVVQQIRFLQLDELTAKVAKLRTQFSDRAAKKDDLVNKRVEDLMKPSPPLNW
jgi:hypothetical protein